MSGGGLRLARQHPLLCAALLGALAAACLPPLTIVPVLFVCVPGLLALLEHAPRRGRAFRLGWVFGFTHYICGIYWITSAILVRAAEYWWLVPIAVPALAAIFASLTGLAALVAWHARGRVRRVLALAGAWVLTDLARQFIATGFPWNLWGSSVELPGGAGDVLIQLACLIGIHGLTLLVLLITATPWLGWTSRGIGAAALAGWIGFGLWRVHLPAAPSPNLAAVVIQGNVAEGQKWGADTAERVFGAYLRLSRDALEAAGPGPKVLIWPETASPFLLGQDAPARQAIAAAAGGTPALIGAVRFVGQTPFNSLFVLDPPPAIQDVYDKWHLVPFGEYQPGWLPGVQLGQQGGFGFGPGPRTLHAPGLPPFGPLICYETVFTGQVIDRHERPAWLVNITNDAWFGNSSGPRQHLAAARMRAVEEGLPLVRAANTGISAAFDARGHELGRLGLNRTGAIRLPVAGALPPTLYARGGLMIPLALAVLSLAAGLAGGIGRDRGTGHSRSGAEPGPLQRTRARISFERFSHKSSKTLTIAGCGVNSFHTRTV